MKHKIDYHQKAYVCIDVFNNSRPVLLISRPDGDWCLTCGDYHEDDSSEYRVVGIGHLLDRDPSICEVLDLEADWEVERSAPGAQWKKVKIED